MTAPYPAVPTFADGNHVQQYQLNGMGSLLNGLYTHDLGGFVTLPPLCALRVVGASQSIPNAVDTQVSWDTADINNGGMWSVSSPGFVTISVSGVYMAALLLATSGTATELGVRIVVNGFSPSLNGITCFSAQALRGMTTGIAYLTAGATVSAYCYQKNASPATLSTSFGSCRMAVFRISD